MKELSLIILFLWVIFAGCDDSGDCLTSYGKTESKSIDIPLNISEIYINQDIDTKFIFDSTSSISITYGSNLLDNIKINVSGNKLELTNQTQCIWNKKPGNHPEAEIHLPSINYIQHNGYGSLDFADTLHTNEFKLECYTSAADIKVLLNTDFSALKVISGPAKIEALGVTEELYTYHSASGMIYAQHLNSEKAHSFSDGKGDTYIYARNKLKVDIKHFGDIYYRGQPSINKAISGKGKLIPLDY